MEASKIKLIYRYLSNTGLKDHKDDLVIQHTNGRTNSLHEMKPSEANLMIKALQEIDNQKRGKMRKKIWHLLCLYGMTDNRGNADADRINDFIRNIGSNNPKKKDLFYLNVKEMRAVLNQVEVMVNKTLHNS